MSSPTKSPPLKPPRIQRTVSVPTDPSSVSSSPETIRIQEQQCAAKMNIMNALNKAKARERSLSKLTSDGNSSNESNGGSPPITIKTDPTTTIESIITEDNSASPYQQKKNPIIPHSNGSSFVPVKPKPPPSYNKPLQENQDISDDETCALPIEPSSPSPLTPPKRPLLPPSKPRATTSPTSSSDNSTPSPLQKHTRRSVSIDTPSPPNRLKPLPIPKSKSHDKIVDCVIGPEEIVKMTVDMSEESEENTFEEEASIVNNNIETNTIPVSPSSISSGPVPDDNNADNPSPNMTESNRVDGTTSSCIIERDEVCTNRSLSPNDNVSEETDGGQITCPVQQPQKPKKTLGSNQRRVVLKDSSSWIKKKNNDPSPTNSLPPSIATPPTVTPPIVPPSTVTPSKTTSNPHRPYRSIAILPDKPPSFSATVLLQDTSKPLIGPNGQYYPPAMRSRTPDCLDSTRVSDLAMRKTQSNEKLLVIQKDDEEFNRKNDVPKRFKKTRRSSSFNGEQKIRPVSMMDHIHRKDKESFSSSSTFNRSMTESAKDVILKEDKKTKSTSKVRGLFGFRSKGKLEPLTDEISSSDDEVGGTISRMPKQSFDRKPWETQVSDSVTDEYVPEYDKLFEYVFVFGLKEDSKKKLSSEIVYKYPPATDPREFGKDDALRSIDQFCFPDIEQWKPVLSYQSESYSFVLTDMDGSRRFGYCRRLLPNGTNARLPEVYCIISPLGCFDLYSNLLDRIEERRCISKATVYRFLSSIVNNPNPFPGPGRSVSIRVPSALDDQMEIIELRRHHDSRLEHVDFAELYNTLGPKMLLHVFSSLLMERRVILAAQRLSKLSSCCHALLALLYPFEWQHTFIPVLPHSLIDFCGSPLPFIIGISPTMAKQLDKLDIQMEEALVVDLDRKKFLEKFGDESSILPNKLTKYLISKLEATIVSNEYSKPPSQRAGQHKADQIIVHAFMTVFAYFFGEIKQFLHVTNITTGERKLQKSDFIKSFHSKSTRRFMEAFLMTQMFDKFIEERENPVMSATISQGLFEMKLPELMEKVPEIELFSNKKKFWKKKKPGAGR